MKQPPRTDRIRRLTGGTTSFLKTDIWQMRLNTLPRHTRIWIKPLRLLILSSRKFKQDGCMLRASALTFYSLLSIVPVLAMAFGIAKGFGFEKALEAQLLTRLQAQEAVITRIMGFAQSLLDNTKGGIIAGTGVVLLLWTIMSLLGNIENAFNRIWDVDKPRSPARKVSDYFSAMVVCPLLLVLSSGATVVIISQVTLIIDKISFLGALGPAILFVLKLLPYAVIWILFTFIYLFMPNRKIGLGSGVFAGVLAGTLYQVFQWAYLSFQFGVTRYNAIYGSFAALPLFLVWLQISWLIVLFGAVVSYAHQNQEAFELAPESGRISHHLRTLLTLQVVHLLVKAFTEGQRPVPAPQIARSLDLPHHLLHDILRDLVAAGIISPVCSAPSGERGYQPARDSDLLTIEYVMSQMESLGTPDLPRDPPPTEGRLMQSLEAFQDLIRKSPANLKLKDL